ncbi:MAG: extracellular solute-binding protein [Clostridiales bacterium]|nr:extracellular solute-binding protein [Clostridiales bacterium]
MKKLTALLLAALMLATLVPGLVQAEGVKLTMGSWRSDDTAQVQALLDKYKELTGVEITFQPTVPAQYNATLRLQLDNGTGPDLMYSRTFAASKELYDAGFLLPLNDIAALKDNFSAASLEAFMADDGTIYAVPYAAVSQIVYYNKAIFAENNLEVPTTFEELLNVAQALKDKGIEPLANGIASNWDILECVFLGMLPNYVGGAEERALYEAGERKMNDEAFVKALTDFAALSKYLPEGFEALANEDGPGMFGMGRAAMFIDGSWTVGMFDEYPDLDLGVFAIPAPEGHTPGLCFHSDMGMAGNAATQHPEEVKAFLAWFASVEGAQEAANLLPAGFYPMINAPVELSGEMAMTILGLNEGKVLDYRFIWKDFLGMYTVMVDNLNAIARGETTPEAAAEAFAAAQEEILAAKAE